MNDYLSRAELPPIDRASARGSVAPISPAMQVASESEITAQAGSEKANDRAQTVDPSFEDEEHLASAAEYARVHARIASIMAGIRSAAPAAVSSYGAEEAVSSLLPARVVIVPLPPASKDMVERAEEVARDIAERSAQSVAAQAHVKPGTVDQMMATVS